MWSLFPMIRPFVIRNPKSPSIPQIRRCRRMPIFRPYLERLEDRTVPSSITVLASDLHTAGGLPQQMQVAETGTVANGNKFTFNAAPGVYHLTIYGGGPTYGSFTVASDGTISSTTGALTASGNTIDFDVTKLAAVTVFGTDLKTAAGRQQTVNVFEVVSLVPGGQGTDTVYLPAGTFYVNDRAGDNYGTFMVSADSSGTLAVSATSGAAVATGNTIHFDVNQLAAVTIFGTDLTTAAGQQQNVGVSEVVPLFPPGGYSGVATDTVYLPGGIYRLIDYDDNVYGGFTVSAIASGALAVTSPTGAAVATGNTIHFDLTKLAAVTIFGTDLKTPGGLQQWVLLSGVGGITPTNQATDTVYAGAGTYTVSDRNGNAYGRFTVSVTASGALAVTGTTGAVVATGNMIHLDPCILNRVQITPNSGIRWDIGNTTLGASYASDVVALGDGSYSLDLEDPSGHFTSAIFSVSSSLGLSATQLPQNAPLATLALVPCLPVVGPITAPLTPVPVNTSIAASASFTDPDELETHTAVWNWGDGTTSPGTVSESNGSGTVSGSHSYAMDGVYTITLTVTDNVGGSGQSVFNYVVVYNPSAGFVTGGGWFNSPAGAVTANPTLTGKANFGFNVKYHSGSTVPDGQTQFQFPAANLDFHSTSYDWLVINGNQAQFQGSGTINGAGNYGFLVSVVDNDATTSGGPDAIRIKIWDKNNNNAVVYDTQPGAAATVTPTTALGGGDIQVHTSNTPQIASVVRTSGGTFTSSMSPSAPPAGSSDASSPATPVITSTPAPIATNTPVVSASSVSSNTGSGTASQASLLDSVAGDISQWEDAMMHEWTTLVQTVDQLFIDWERMIADSFGANRPE